MQKPTNESIRQFYLDRLDRNPATFGGQSGMSLGIGRLIAGSFSILFHTFPVVVAVGFVPSLLGAFLSGILVGLRHTVGLEDADPGAGAMAYFLSAAIDLLVFSITTAFLVQLACDAKLGRPIRFTRYLLPALTSIVPISVLSLAIAVLLTLAAFPVIIFAVFSSFEIFSVVLFLALAVVGIWVYAVWSVMPPAIVVEGAGFRGLGRSAALTRGYRWPIIASIAPVWICSVAIVLTAAALTGPVEAVAGLAAATVLYALANAIGTGLVSILVSILYARLREIREGVSIDQIADVFD